MRASALPAKKFPRTLHYRILESILIGGKCRQSTYAHGSNSHTYTHTATTTHALAVGSHGPNSPHARQTTPPRNNNNNNNNDSSRNKTNAIIFAVRLIVHSLHGSCSCCRRRLSPLTKHHTLLTLYCVQSTKGLRLWLVIYFSQRLLARHTKTHRQPTHF